MNDASNQPKDTKIGRGRGRPRDTKKKITIKTTITLTAGQDDDLIAHFSGVSGRYSHIVKRLMRSGLGSSTPSTDVVYDSKADLTASLDAFLF